MKTKLFSTTLIGMLAFIIVSCSTDDTVNNEMQERVIQTSMSDYHFKGQPLTLKKSGNTVTKTIKFFTASGPFGFDYTMGGCAPFPYLTVSGSGNASHIGNYTVLNQGCYDGQSLILGTITAANGDEIHTYIASVVQDEDTGISYYHYVVYNGTGRFYNVYGDIYLEGTLNFENFTWSFTGDGTITY